MWNPSDTLEALPGFDPVNGTCYKFPFCAGSLRPGPISRSNFDEFLSTGAKSDAAKLHHSYKGLAVEACSEFRKQLRVALCSDATAAFRT
jgi:hypothetical protein